MLNTIESIYKNTIHCSSMDYLTGLPGHGVLLFALEQWIERTNAGRESFALALLDIDDFAFYNHRHGSLQGDVLLQRFGQALLNNLSETDIASRYGGNRFCVIFRNTGGVDRLLEKPESLKAALENEIGGEITISIGVSSIKTNMVDGVEHIMKEACSALAQAKAQGKNRVNCFREASTSLNIEQSRILLVDDEPLNLKYMEGVLRKVNCTIQTATNGLEALEITQGMEVDLVLLDIMMPSVDGLEVCRTLKATEETRMIPVILLTALDDVETKIAGIEAGADDFLTKPPHRAELLARVKSLLRLKRLNSNLTSIENVLFSMAKAVEAKDSYTQGHVDRVSEIAMTIGRDMGLSHSELEALRLGGALHDIGKMGIPEEILNKPGPLNEREWTIMKTHPEIGYRICLPLKKSLGQALEVVRSHHEKMDGSGYPDGMKNGEIPMVARIMAVADIFDALVTDRPYRKAMSLMRALEILRKDAAEGKLDPEVVDCLIRRVWVNNEYAS